MRRDVKGVCVLFGREDGESNRDSCFHIAFSPG